MNRTYSLVCAAAFLAGGVAGARAQLLGHGGLVGGVTGNVTGAVNETGAPGGAVGGVNDGIRGTAANGGMGAVASMRQNTALASSVQPLLPKGADVTQAAAGFQNTTQFMTTVHAAHNMNIPFDQLKARTTGKGHVSLDKAARQLRPDLDEKAVKENLKLAEKQSDRDLLRTSTPAGKDRVAAMMESDSQLSSRVGTLLPAGSNVASAATGFHDENEFISTAQASHNLNLPFEDMKDRVTAGQSLGDAIHAMKPGMSESEARASAQAANHQALQLRTGGNAQTNATARADGGHSAVSANATAQADVR